MPIANGSTKIRRQDLEFHRLRLANHPQCSESSRFTNLDPPKARELPEPGGRKVNLLAFALPEVHGWIITPLYHEAFSASKPPNPRHLLIIRERIEVVQKAATAVVRFHRAWSRSIFTAMTSSGSIRDPSEFRNEYGM